jgi:hypothetical protein
VEERNMEAVYQAPITEAEYKAPTITEITSLHGLTLGRHKYFAPHPDGLYPHEINFRISSPK